MHGHETDDVPRRVRGGKWLRTVRNGHKTTSKLPYPRPPWRRSVVLVALGAAAGRRGVTVRVGRPLARRRGIVVVRIVALWACRGCVVVVIIGVVTQAAGRRCVSRVAVAISRVMARAAARRRGVTLIIIGIVPQLPLPGRRAGVDGRGGGRSSAAATDRGERVLASKGLRYNAHPPKTATKVKKEKG